MELSYPNAKFFVALAVLLLLDPLWLYASHLLRLYPIEDSKSVIVAFGLIPWTVIAIAIGMSRPPSTQVAAVFGFALGLLSYAFYNGTVAAFDKRWRNLRVTACDIAWGSILCTFASVVAFAGMRENDKLASGLSGIIIVTMITCIAVLDHRRLTDHRRAH